MKSLTAAGQRKIIDIILEMCNERVNPSAFFEDAEDKFNDGENSMEVSRQYTLSGNPEHIKLLPEWFA
jgi:hypothetical protein